MAVQPKASVSHGLVVKQGRKKTVKAGVKRKVLKKPTGSLAAAAISPFVGFKKPSPQEVTSLHTCLARFFGERRPAGGRRRDILDTVVGTILSQNTTNTNSHMAFTKLKKRFGTWDAVRTASPKAVEEEIRCGGLAPKKTKWIQHICQTLHEERGDTSMEYLRKLSKEEVHGQLERFTGVGKKTSAIINLFDVGHPDMAVDTHVFRYTMQLGWAPSEAERKGHNAGATLPRDRWPSITRDTVYAHLDATYPDRLKYSMHLLLTDTDGGLPVVCNARNVLSFDGKAAFVDGRPLQEVVKEKKQKKNGGS